MFRIHCESQLAHQTLAMFVCCRFANYREEPRPKRRLAAESRFAFKDLQVDRLQNFFRFRPVATTATQRPAKTGSVVFLQLMSQLRDVHRVNAHGLGSRTRSVFKVLVVWASELYDRAF